MTTGVAPCAAKKKDLREGGKLGIKRSQTVAGGASCTTIGGLDSFV